MILTHAIAGILKSVKFLGGRRIILEQVPPPLLSPLLPSGAGLLLL
jgi:hypothetical protein